MTEGQDIILVADYHAENIEYRWFNRATGEERTGRYPTTAANILWQVQEAAGEVSPGGVVVWIMESTTGWARVESLLGERVKFLLANVLEMPLPPKARRRKTDKLDTARLLREYLSGTLPQAFQPPADLRQARRLVDLRQDLVERRTALKNWIGSLLHHETWQDRSNLWTAAGLRRLRGLALPESDRQLVAWKLQELELLERQLAEVEGQMRALYERWPEAQRLDEIRGIGLVTAVTLAAHIGPAARFATAEDLVSYAGLAPAVHNSDQTRRNGKIGGGGTDRLLRYLVIESTTWLQQIPRYRPTWQRVAAKRGKRVARIVLGRLLLRSVHKMLRDGVRFNPAPRPRRSSPTFTGPPAAGVVLS